MGRITLNPAVHIDPFMTILLPIMTLVSMGFAFGGAKPVPINPTRLRNPKRDMMLTAAAGPASNLVLALIGVVLFVAFFKVSPVDSLNRFVFRNFIFINVLLMGFNLIPIPPLDGSRILRFFLPSDLRDAFASYGEVTSVNIVTDRDTGRPRGFAFVEMTSDSEAQAAIDGLNGQDLQGRSLTVNVARPRENRGGGAGAHPEIR